MKLSIITVCILFSQLLIQPINCLSENESLYDSLKIIKKPLFYGCNEIYYKNGKVYKINNNAAIKDSFIFSPKSKINYSNNRFVKNQGVNVNRIENIDLICNIFLHGQYFDLKCKNDLCYTAATYGLVVIDISNPANPTIISYLPTRGCAWGIDIDDQFAYLADYYGGLSIIDISDPLNPFMVSNIYTDADAWDIEVVDNIAYLSTLAGNVIINVANKEEPYIVSGPEGHGSWSLTIKNNYLYTVDLALSKYKIESPSNLTFEWYITDGLSDTWNKGIAISDSFVYIGSRDLGISVIKNSNPPSFINNCNTGAGARGVSINNNKIFVANISANNNSDTKGLSILDATKGDSLLLISEVNENLHNENVFVYNNTAYLTGWEGVSAVNIDELSDPQTIGLLANNGENCENVSLGNNVMCLDMTWFIDVYDISNVSQPILKSTINKFSVGSIIQDNILFAGANSNMLQIYELNNLTNPILIKEKIFDNVINSLTFYNGYLFLSMNPQNILVVDISDLSDPVVVAEIITDGCPWGTKINDSKVYSVTGNKLEIYDISNLNNIYFLGSCALPGFTFAIDVKDDFAFVSINNQDALQVIDISNPTQPNIINTYTAFSDWGNNIQINGNFAFLSMEYYGLEVIDISDVNNLMQVGYYDTPGSLKCTKAEDNGFIFVADGHDFSILHFDPTVYIEQIKSDLNKINFFEIRPNPFYSNTTIYYNILEDNDNVDIQIYDISGKSLIPLLNESKNTGNYTLKWNGNDKNGVKLPVGIYFCQIKTKNYLDNSKIIILN